MKKFMEKSFELFDKGWALVTAGNMDSFNTMTISWGGLGTLWNKPVATVYVKPIRYTHDFLDENQYFTVSFFDNEYREDLSVLGTLSGKDGDKIAKTQLTAVPMGDCVTFKQAKLTLLCKKIYRQDMDKAFMPDFAAEKYYTDEAEHTMYVGEVVEVAE